MDHRAAIEYLPQEQCKFLVAFYRQSLAADPSKQPYGCWIPQKKSSDKAGYVKIALKREDYIRGGVAGDKVDELFSTGNERNVFLHVISYKAKHGHHPNGKEDHSSHLCGVPACFNWDHIVKDSAVENNGRKNCPRCVLLPTEPGAIRRVVVVVCNGHGTLHKCVLPIKYANNPIKYKIVQGIAKKEITTKLGNGGHTKINRNTFWRLYKERNN